MKKLISSLTIGLISLMMSGQTTTTSPTLPPRGTVSPAPSSVVLKNGRNQLCHARPIGDRLLIKDLKRHLRQEIRRERHLKRELRRLRRERALRQLQR